MAFSAQPLQFAVAPHPVSLLIALYRVPFMVVNQKQPWPDYLAESWHKNRSMCKSFVLLCVGTNPQTILAEDKANL
jgi:hypothetical protein